MNEWVEEREVRLMVTMIMDLCEKTTLQQFFLRSYTTCGRNAMSSQTQ